MKLTRKLLALLLTIALCLSLVPTLANASSGENTLTPAERELKIAELLDFSSRLHNMKQKYAPEAAREDSDNLYANARIIVKSAQELSYEGALSFVNGHNDLHIIQYATPEEAEKACAMYSKMAGVEYAEPDSIASIAATPGDDSFLSWGFGETHVDAFGYNEWILDYSNGVANLPDVVVAVIDTGADSDHPFIMDRLVPGYDFENDDSNPEDDHYHGTHVSGTIVDGTLSNVSVMALKALDSGGSGDQSKIALAMEYAYLNGADVVNMSLRGRGQSQLYIETINAGEAYGTVYCVASGNDSGNALDYCPGNVEKAITVAATDSNNAMAYFSNTGSCVDISAPGVAINSARLGGGYRELDGTSMATPHVAAVAAMIKSYNTNYAVEEVASIIKLSAAPASFVGGGAGLLRAGADLLRYDVVVNAEGSTAHFTSPGSNNWIIDGDAVRSGNAGINNSTSTLTARVDFAPYQVISFDYKVSSDSGDSLVFSVNDEVVMTEYGEHDWNTFTYTVAESGTYTLTWEFVKDGSGSAGSDAAWIDEFSIDDTLSSILNTGNGNFLFETTTQYPWTIDGDAAKSGNGGVAGSVSEIETTLTSTAGLSFVFEYMVTPGSGDKFEFIVNDQILLEVTTSRSWTEYQYTIPEDGEYNFTFRYTKNLSGSDSDAAWVKNVDLYFTLEAALNVPGGNLNFDTSSNYPWVVVEDYAMSGNAGTPNTQSSITLSINMNAGDTLTFSYRVSSEANYDTFRFTANGTQVISESGQIAWRDYTYTAATTRTYEFSWSYNKDGSVNTSEDAVFIDNIAVSGTGGVTPGDSNGDGDITASDSLLALRYSIGLIDESQLDIEAADINDDGDVTAADALIILRLALDM